MDPADVFRRYTSWFGHGKPTRFMVHSSTSRNDPTTSYKHHQNKPSNPEALGQLILHAPNMPPPAMSGLSAPSTSQADHASIQCENTKSS